MTRDEKKALLIAIYMGVGRPSVSAAHQGLTNFLQSRGSKPISLSTARRWLRGIGGGQHEARRIRRN